MKALLAETRLANLIQEVSHPKGEYTVTHTLRPSALVRLTHQHNLQKFGLIFGADPARLKDF